MPRLLRLGISVAFVPAELGFTAELGGAATTTFPVTLAGGAPTYTPAGPPLPAAGPLVPEPPAPAEAGPPAWISGLHKPTERPTVASTNSPRIFPSWTFMGPVGATCICVKATYV